MVRPVVVVESPYRGYHSTTDKAEQYARDVCALVHGARKIPFASHLIYPQFMDDDDAADREDGILYGRAIGAKIADEAWFVTAHGRSMSEGMRHSLSFYQRIGVPCYRLWTSYEPQGLRVITTQTL
jgi:hypothetical protein